MIFLNLKRLTAKCMVCLLFSAHTFYGQNTPTEHMVQKGDNVYRLSLKYGVSINDIYSLNPTARDVIKIGDTLLIPTNIADAKFTENNANKDAYVVQRGETIYGLSKKFGVSISQLENANPIIKNGLQAGQSLIIPKGSNVTETKALNAEGTHKVLKGETLWGISRQYNMSLDELKSLNNFSSGRVLLAGEVLLIEATKHTTNTNTYTVQKGDTKYGLSKKFGISIADLERLNPSIVSMLKAGDVLVFELLNKTNSSKVTVAGAEGDFSIKSETEKINDDAGDNNWYVIKPKETLYGLSKKANMSIEEFTALNPKLKQAVQAGDTIKMRYSKPEKIEQAYAYTRAKNLWQTHVFLYHPDSEFGENVSINHKDYYTGIKNAIKDIGTNTPNIKVITNISSKASINSLAPKTKDIFNIIPQPEFNGDMSNMGNFECGFIENGAPKKKMIRALVSEAEMRIKMLLFLASTKANIICIYDEEHSNNITHVKNYTTAIKLIKLNKNGSFKPNEFKNLLDSNNLNYVIIESRKTGVFLNVSNLLLKELSKYNSRLAVLNYKNIPDENEVSFKRFKILKLAYPMAYNPNYIKEKELVSKLGYVISYDVLTRISSGGLRGFDNQSEVLGLKFNYTTIGNTIQNTAVSIYVFGDNSNAELLETL